MAFTLTIKRKGLFNKKKINLQEMLLKTNMVFGSINEFYVLEEGRTIDDTFILYNPTRIGRGIFVDARKVHEGEMTISYNIPTTPVEIKDFIRLAKEIERQFKKVSMFCEEEKRIFTSKTLEDDYDEMVNFSLVKMHDFCMNEDFEKCILTLARFPWYIPVIKREEYKKCKSLADFENVIHELQNMDVYYAKPAIYQTDDGKTVAVYTFTEECVSVFPFRGDCFLNFSDRKIDDVKIRFYIFSEKKVLDGIYSYESFVSYLKDHEIEIFDAEHFIAPSVSKEEIMKIVNVSKE